MGLGRLLGGAGLGWAFGGPIGALFGAIAAHFVGQAVDERVDASDEGGRGGYNPFTGRQQTTQADFALALLAMSAAVMKADGKVMRSELDYVKQFCTQQFGAEYTKEYMQQLKLVLDKDINVRQICLQIRSNMPHPMRLQLIHYLFGISRADGHVDSSEVNVINKIANYLGISHKDFQSIQSMFYKDSASAYKVLEVEKSATDAEVKKAYRRMAVKYHPDKVADLGEAHQNAAKEKFQKVQDAYDTIKKERGIK